MATEKATSTRASVTTAERTAFKAGDAVEFDGKLAKVINFGFLEIPTNPGQDAKFSEELVANLQLPAAQPGGMPEYAFNVPAGELKALKDDPKRLRALEKEFNPLFGEKPPAEPAEPGKAPEIRQSGPAPKAKRTSSTRGKESAEAPRGSRPPVDMVAKGGEKVVTGEEKPAKKSAKKSSSKKAKGK